MNSLVSYGSDDNSDDSGDERFPEMPGHPNQAAAKNYRKPATHEDNYEEVGMDMSEDSNGSGGPTNQPFKSNNPQNRDNRSRSKSPKHKRDEDDKRNVKNEDRNRDDRFRDDRHSRRRDDERDRRRNDDKGRRRDDDRDKTDRSRRDDDKGRDKNRDDRRDRRDDRYGRDRRGKRRSKSRDRRRPSKSPKRSSPRRNSRSPRRSRSGSKDEEYKTKGFTSRREKADKRMDRLGKLGIEFKPDNYPASAIEEAERNSKDNGKYFVPGITGRFRDQIEKRKLLWQKAKEPESKSTFQSVATCSTSAIGGAGGSKATKVYEATTFSDDRTSNKFKRLMGIRETNTSTLPVKSTDVLKKQQEMFTSMEAQYEVARTATHTMRGVGLGFGSFQR